MGSSKSDGNDVLQHPAARSRAHDRRRLLGCPLSERNDDSAGGARLDGPETASRSALSVASAPSDEKEGPAGERAGREREGGCSDETNRQDAEH